LKGRQGCVHHFHGFLPHTYVLRLRGFLDREEVVVVLLAQASWPSIYLVLEAVHLVRETVKMSGEHRHLFGQVLQNIPYNVIVSDEVFLTVQGTREVVIDAIDRSSEGVDGARDVDGEGVTGLRGQTVVTSKSQVSIYIYQGVPREFDASGYEWDVSRGAGIIGHSYGRGERAGAYVREDLRVASVNAVDGVIEPSPGLLLDVLQ